MTVDHPLYVFTITLQEPRKLEDSTTRIFDQATVGLNIINCKKKMNDE
jgi:hypothetical protein